MMSFFRKNILYKITQLTFYYDHYSLSRNTKMNDDTYELLLNRITEEQISSKQQTNIDK